MLEAFRNVQLPNVESERLRQQALMTEEMDKKHLLEVKLPSQPMCLDLGCGIGLHAILMADLLDAGLVLGIDTNTNYLETAKALALKVDAKNIIFDEGDINNLVATLDSSSDFVFSRLLFQHLKDPDRALIQAKKVLKPGGKLMVIDTDGS